MRYDPDIDPDIERDEPKERKVTQDGTTAVIYPIDPHGFWRVKIEKQKVQPKEFEGCYTSVHEAQKAVLTYFNAKKLLASIA